MNQIQSTLLSDAPKGELQEKLHLFVQFVGIGSLKGYLEKAQPTSGVYRVSGYFLRNNVSSCVLNVPILYLM